MKKIILTLMLLVGFGAIAKADFSMSQWQFQKDIKNFSQGLVDVQLDKEVFANSARLLADLRVVDNENKEVPYKLVTANAEDSQRQYNPKVINNSVVAGKYSTAIIDLGQEGNITNSVTVKTTSENFQRNVTVYGSDDQNSWNILKSNAYIYDYTDKKGGLKTQDTSVSFPDSVFRFLKIEISDVDNSPVVISSIQLNQFVKKNAQEFSTQAKFETNEDAASKSTVLLVDLGQSGIPTNKIILGIGGENFNRGITVTSSNDKNSFDWKYVGQGYVFRYNTPKFSGENVAVLLNETTNRYIKITVHNNDNAPVAFTEVQASSTLRDLMFQADAGKTYRLFYGNSKASTPQYDLEKYFQYLDLNSAQKAVLDTQRNNSAFMPDKKPLTEQNTFLVPSLLAFACLSLLVLVYNFLKSSS